jgi:hypothetical protein
VSNTTTQVIVQIAPSTAIATATNYGHGSASATAVAAPTQIASQSAITRADDPASNVGSGHQTADNTTSNYTTQTINQYAPTTATADATSYNGHAVATAIAAPTQIATQRATTMVFGNGDNVGLGGVSCGFLCGSGHQTVTNTATNTTSQSISQHAPTTATADATSFGGGLCGICDFGGNSGNATAIAIAKPVQIASQTANDTVSGTATNVSLGRGHQTADNTTTNTTDQSIDQRANSTATATATNDPFGFNNSQSATAVAVSQPSQLAVQGALNVVTGSANNSALGFGCDCVFFGGSHQTAINTTTNTTDQDITQHGNADATATADNNAFGFGNHQTATAIAVAAPKQSASEYSSAYVSGIATNIGLGHGSDQFAFNVTTNEVPQTITQNANSDATADADNNAFGFNKSQNAQATAIAAPSQTAGITAHEVVKGQAINTDLGSSSCSLCDLFGGHTHQTATNETYNSIPQTITQRAPVTADAYAYNNGFGFDFGLCEICSFGQFGNFGNFGNNSGSIQNATAVAASAPVQRAGEALSLSASGVAANVNLGNGSVHQDADNTTYSDATQSITQRAPSDVYADAENNPALVPTLTSECFLSCGHFGSGSVRAQNATAIATAQPSQTASETMSQTLSGSAINIASGNSNSCSHCGCDFWCGSNGRVHQDADNYVESGPEQTITQHAPTTVDAYAYNWPTGDSIVPESLCFSSCGHNFGNSFGGTQSATAIAAAQPVQSASETYWASVSGQALNTLVRTGNSCGSCGFFGGSSYQHASNDVENFPYQTITQRAPVDANADAENWAFGHGSQQQALAIAVGAPRQLASEFERDYVLGTASNVSLSSGSVHQDADNTTYNGVFSGVGGYQTITQRAPVDADAYAYNYPSSSMPWFFGFGNGGLQSATAIAAGAPLQIASQVQDRNYVSGVASNVNLGGQCGSCGFFGLGASQDATNYTDNEVYQRITQRAPTTVTADAENEGQASGWWCIFSGCSNNPQTATAIATSAAKQTANEKASAWLTGNATNVNLSNNFGGCHLFFCGFGHEQDADNTSLNTLDQFLTQRARSDSEATAFNSPSWFDLGGIWGQGGNWSGCGSCGGLGLNTLSPLAGLTSNLGYGVPSFNAPLFSTPVTLSGLNGLGNLGSTNIAFGGQDLGIKLGLNIGNSESLNLPTVSNLLHGVSLFGLLQGAVSLSLNLSVTTPWVQYAAAVAHQTPYSVLFSVSQQQGIAPWLGILL